MKRLIIAFMALTLLAGFVGVSMADEAAKKGNPTYYVCACGADCKCDTVSAEPGDCKCKKPMVKMNLLKIEDGSAYFCTCDAGCSCKINADDSTKCGCGKPVKKVSLKGKYVCGCGPDCKCGAISDKPGKCGCGKDLVLVP